MENKTSIESLKQSIRVALANYMSSEGCSCCEDSDHSDHAAVLAKLLDVPEYEDGSGYDFFKYIND